MDDIEPEPAVDVAASRGTRGGPGAPAVLRRIPWLALVFVALAVADLYWMLRQADFLAGMSVGDVIGYGLRLTPGIAAILLPAAVLASHRDSWRRIPTVVFGTILFASVQGLAVVADPLQPIFASLTPASDDLPDLVPLAALFDAVVSLVFRAGRDLHRARSGPGPAVRGPAGRRGRPRRPGRRHAGDDHRGALGLALRLRRHAR